MPHIWSTERKIMLGFGSALLALGIVAGLSIWMIISLLNDLQAVADQNTTLTRISEANGIAPQLATYARLLAVNHERATFLEWEKQEVEFRAKLLEIQGRTGDSPSQRQRMANIIRLLDDKVRVTTLDADRQTIEDAWGIKQGYSQMRPITDLLLAMGVEERDYLTTKNVAATQKAVRALWTIGIAFAIALLLTGVAVTTILRDLLERRRAAEELERARQAAEAASIAKSSFLANMSHELRTPLTSIMGYVDLMLDPATTAAGRPEYLQTIRRSGEHLLNLINDILDVSKIEAGRMTIETVDSRLVDIFAEVDSLMRTRAISKAINFSIEYETPIPDRVMIDPTRFRQILVNLLSNAIKFTDEGSVRMLVNCESHPASQEPARLIVDVVDTGVGISPDQQKKLFQPFSQADISTTRRFGGTGLGLSISRRLAQMLGGDLSVQSQLDQGSTFRLALPVEPVAGSIMIPPGRARHLVDSAAQAGSQTPKSLGLRVLLAEDGAENRDVILLHLRQADCVATAVEDGQQAYETAMNAWRSGEPFDMVLMDMQMPVMDGYTATSKLRANGYAGPIIALTAHAMKEDRQRCLRVGCDEYAPKPINMPQLLQLMARFSGRLGSKITVTEKLLENPALRALTRKFCSGIPATLENLTRLATAAAWADLSTSAHRLAGAGGAYGFEDISRAAKSLERAAKSEDTTQVTEALARLSECCTAAYQQLQTPSAN